jgi:maleylacetoacetate isomerase
VKLYTYFRSSAAYRVRIALHYKNLKPQICPIHLIEAGGQQYQQSYVMHQPQALVPSLSVNEGDLNQSLAIIEYLEEVYPEKKLLPASPFDRATVRAMALHIACEMHPLNNLRVLNYLKDDLHISDEEKMKWYRHWMHLGFSAFEKRLEQYSGDFCFKDQFTLADVFFVPQVYNALRFHTDLSVYPLIEKIYARVVALPFVEAAKPEAQPDAPSLNSSS